MKKNNSPKSNLSAAQGLFTQYREEINSPSMMIITSEKGLEIHFFDELLKLTGMNKAELAGIIEATPKTIDNRRAGRRRLGRKESEHLLQILALFKKGEELFGSVSEFSGWLRKPAFGLGSQLPFSLIHSPQGIELVMDELYRIEFGALA